MSWSRFLVFAAAVSASVCAFATNYTWCGDGGDGEWTNPQNWLMNGSTVVEAGYPGVNAAGGASTSDNAMFPANAEATVTLRDALQINQLDLSRGGIKLKLVGGTAGTNNLLTIGNDLKVNAPENELTLDNFGIMRNGAVTLGVNAKLNLVNAAFFRQNGLAMSVDAGVSLSGGSQMYVNGAISPVANGCNSVSLAGGSIMTVANASTLTAGFELSLTDASFFNFKNKLTAYLARLISLTGKSRLIVDNELDIMNDGQAVLIDDSTLETKYFCYLVNTSPGGGMITFRGANPRFICRSLIRAGYNNASFTKPVVFNFVVPEGGFAEVPVQNMQKDYNTFGDCWNPKVLAKFTVDPASPAVTAGSTTEQALLLSVKGIVGVSKYNYLDLTDTTAAMRVTDGTPDGTAGVVKDNYATQHAVFATIGSGAAATRAASVSKVGTDPLSISINRRTITVLAPVVGVSSSAAKSCAQLLVGESGSTLEPVAAQEIVSPGIYAISWTAPEGKLETDYSVAVRVVGLNASGAEVDSDTTPTFATRTLDTTTYYWTGKGGDGRWSNLANWRTDFGDDMLGYPKTSAATADFPANTEATIVMDEPITVGKLYTTQRSDVKLRIVNGGASTNENLLTISTFELNGCGGEIVFDKMAVKGPGFTPGQGRRIVFTNGSDFYCTGDVTQNNLSAVVFEKDSTASINQLVLQDNNANDGEVIIDDSTVMVRNHVLAPNNAQLGARLLFRGTHPVLRVAAANSTFRANNAVGGAKVHFLIPAGGYTTCPIQGTGAMTVPFGNSSASAAGVAKMAFTVLPESPVFSADGEFTQPLISWTTAGINRNMLDLSCENASGSFVWGENDVTLGLAISASAHADRLTVTGAPLEIPADGISYSNIDGLAAGTEETFTAPSARVGVSDTQRATCTGWKLYAVDQASGKRTVVASSASKTCNYVHPGEYRVLEWQWTVENLVTATAGAGGSVSAAVWCEYGKSVTVTATPADGYVFREWTGGPANGLEFARTTQVAATAPTEITAQFDVALYASPDADGSGDGTYSNPYTLAQAIAAAAARTDATVVLKTGEYPLTATLNITQGVRITSETGNPDDAVICAGKDAKGAVLQFNPIVKSTHADARFTDFTIRGVKASPGCLWLENGTAANLVLTGCTLASGTSGGAAYLKNGRITRSLIANNTFVNATDGGGVKMEGDAALVEYCTITNNVADGYSNGGAGVYMAAGRLSHCVIAHNQSRAPLGHGAYGAVRLNGKGTIEYCLVADNIGGDSGGGLHISNTAGSLVDHCTVVGNHACSSVGGVQMNPNAVMQNSIVWGNRIANSVNPKLEELNASSDYFLGCHDNCLPRDFGVNALVADPCFVDAANGDYRLLPGSPCVELGYGCYPFDFDALQVGLDDVNDKTLLAGELTFAARASGGRGAKDFSWKLDDLNAGTEGAWTAGTAAFTQTFAAGHYRLSVKAADEVTSVTFAREFYVGVTDTVYVVPAGTAGNVPTVPYASEATAANDVNEAIRYCAAGGEMVVADGVYGVTREFCIPRGVTVRSVNGPEKTWIYRDGPYKSGASFRVAHVADADATFAGFCVSNGYWSTTEQRMGTGILNEGGTVSNCWVVKCWAQVGQYSSQMIANMNGLVANCKVFDCYGCGAYGGGAYQLGADAVMRDTEIWGMTAPSSYSYGSGMGMALHGGLGERLYIHDNYNAYGFGGGGGAGLKMQDAELRNSLIVRNQAGGNGGGGVNANNNSVIVNCTIANNDSGQNSSTGLGGGLLIGNGSKVTVVNTVLSGNTVMNINPAATDPDWYSLNAANATFVNCVFSHEGAKTGEGAVVTDNPRFVDAANGDYTLGIGSTLVDAGAPWNWTEDDVDFGGDKRVQGPAVDIGCYEQEVSDTIMCTVDVSGYDTAESAVTVKVTPVGAGLEEAEVKVVAIDANGQEFVSDWGADRTRALTLPVGVYVFKGYVRDGDREGEGANEGGALTVRTKTAYLVPEDGMVGEPAFPYSTWETAATNILDLVPVCGNGSEIVVTNGTHWFSAAAVFPYSVTIRSLEGPERTFFRRVSATIMTGDAMRMVQFLKAGSVIAGFRFENGKGEDLNYGCYISSVGATITNCVFTLASMNYDRAGAVYNVDGYCADCVFTNFTHSGGYGGAYYQQGDSAVAERLFICNNGKYDNFYASGACTIDGGVLRNSTITNNVFTRTGNGSCIGGVRLKRGRLENCLIAGNVGGSGGGGVYVEGAGEIVNCTIVTNFCQGTDEPRAGGLCVANLANAKVTVVNSIIWGNIDRSANRKGDLLDEAVKGASGTLTLDHTLVKDYASLDPSATGCLSGDPKFKNAGFQNFMLSRLSPCVNIGADLEGVEAKVDLAGKPRKFGRGVDLGCYEYVHLGSLIQLR